MPTRIPDAADLATEVADLLHSVNRTIRRAAGGMGDAHSPGQMRALRVIWRGTEPPRMSELADALGIARRSATSVVEDLERLGLVERVDDPVDRRSVRVRLTEAGRRRMAAARRRRLDAAAKVLGRLDETELASLRGLLARLVAA